MVNVYLFYGKTSTTIVICPTVLNKTICSLILFISKLNKILNNHEKSLTIFQLN